MRTWGTAMFSDDLASDIKLEYRNKIGFGKSPVVATEEMINDYQHEINDGDESAVFWLALASTQWNIAQYGKRDREPWGRLKIIGKNTKVEIKKGSSRIYWRRDFDNLLIDIFSKKN